MVFLLRKNIPAYSFVTVYCMNFMMFLWVTIKLCSFSFVPLLALNPGEATDKGKRVNADIALNDTPSQSCGTSLAI